jgi:Response regulator containing CheY-like receiver, AAA-type ATPase, and DNA-binding domains
MNKSILVIDDNLTICLMLKSWLVKKDFNVETASSAEEAKHKVKEQPFDLILTDIRMPEADGFTFLSWVKKYDSDILVIMMTGYADIESAVASMKSGAVDYVTKPIEPKLLFRKIEEAFKTQENTHKSDQFANDFIKPPGKEYEQLFHQLNHIAETNSHRLIIGDRGTGKASAVKYIYEKGIHLSRPLVMWDTDHLTGNSAGRQPNGSEEKESLLMEKFKEAKGGLLYIRKIDQLDKNLQDGLLTILIKQKRDDDFTQVIVSSEKSLPELQKNLIPKLYGLLEKESVMLPSLKGKKQAIIFLTSYFLKFANHTLDKEIRSMDQSIQEQLIQYAWPGNIQELKNTIIKAALLTEGTHIPAAIASDLFGNNEAKNENYTMPATTVQSLRKENYEKEKYVRRWNWPRAIKQWQHPF